MAIDENADALWAACRLVVIDPAILREARHDLDAAAANVPQDHDHRSQQEQQYQPLAC
jgi:hypothetical protein